MVDVNEDSGWPRLRRRHARQPISTFCSGVPASILGGSADINGDGINGDLLPGTRRGSRGRQVTDVGALNNDIHGYNLSLAGTLNPRGQRLPYLVDIPNGTRFGDSFVSQDIQLSYVLKMRGNVKIEATAQMCNAFNVSNLVGPAGLPSSPFSDTLPTGTGLPRAVQFGLRVSF